MSSRSEQSEDMRNGHELCPESHREFRNRKIDSAGCGSTTISCGLQLEISTIKHHLEVNWGLAVTTAKGKPTHTKNDLYTCLGFLVT